MKKIMKAIPGYVFQEYVDGKCVGQEFVAGFEVEYEDSEGNPVYGPTEEEYCPMLMVQPSDGPIPAVTVIEEIGGQVQEVITFPATHEGCKKAEGFFLDCVKGKAGQFEQTLTEDDIAGILSDGEYIVGSNRVRLIQS